MALLQNAEERFLDKVYFEPMSGCWLWGGARNRRTGYAAFRVSRPTRRWMLAHRFSYEHFKGSIPAGMVVDHRCNTEACVNPDHLKVCTQRENVLRSAGLAARNARKTHCAHGHMFDTDNTYMNAKGFRSCRKCHAEREAARRRKGALS